MLQTIIHDFLVYVAVITVFGAGLALALYITGPEQPPYKDEE